MILSKRYFPLWLRFVLFNVGAVLVCVYKGQFGSDWASIFSLVFAFTLMNFVCWYSARNFD